MPVTFPFLHSSSLTARLTFHNLLFYTLFWPFPLCAQQALGAYLLSVRNAGVLKMDDTTDRWLRLLLELSVNHALSSAEVAAQQQVGRTGLGNIGQVLPVKDVHLVHMCTPL